MVRSWRFSVKVPSLPVSRGHHCTVYNALPSFLFLMLKWSQNSRVEPHSRWFLCPFEHVPVRHLALPRFLVTDASGSSWPFLAPDLPSAFSPRGFLLSRNLEASLAHRFWGVVASRTVLWVEPERILMISINLECFYFSEAAETLEVVVHAEKSRGLMSGKDFRD